MTDNTRKRFLLLAVSILALAGISWLELFFRKKQYLRGEGINKIFLFLLINLHVIGVVFLLFLIIRQSIKLVAELQKKTPGSVFKRNLLFAFTILSVLPSLLIFFVAEKLITTNINNWFNERIETSIKNSLVLHEKQTYKLREDLKKSGDKLFIELNKQNFFENLKIKNKIKPQESFNILETILKNNNLTNYTIYFWDLNCNAIIGSIQDEVNIWRKYRKQKNRSMQSLRINFLKILEQLNNTSKQSNQNEQNNNVNLKEKIFDFFGSLYLIKKIDNYYMILIHRYPEEIRNSLIEIQNSISDYKQLKIIRHPIYWNYFFSFISLVLLIIFLSIWCAFYLARGISKPIQSLLRAIEKLRNGELSVQVEELPRGDLKDLVSGFNDMTKALQVAHNQLEQKNIELFMILENIKSAVFFVNKFGRILAYNAASKELVKKYLNLERFQNKKLTFFGKQILEIFCKLVRELIKNNKRQIIKEITFNFKSETKTFLVNLTYINNHLSNTAFKQPENSLLVVIEDLTDIVKINKIKTWQEAAKQMAHEIKNPLTPIQLATQRLQKKYSAQLNQDKIFIESTETILSHVKIIKDLVTHFSEFAQMPAGEIEEIDINKTIREVTYLYQVGYPEINFIYNLQENIPIIRIDKKKIKRVFINLIDNSIRAIKNINSSDKNLDNKNFIQIQTNFNSIKNQIEITVSDSGSGIPEHVKNKLFMPYVSGEKKNMGLGLAIVHEIITQAGGTINFIPTQIGAKFKILLPIYK